MTSPDSDTRRGMFVDNSVQRGLLIRSAIYGSCGLLYFATFSLVERINLFPNRSVVEVVLELLGESLYWLPGLIVLWPILMYDLLRTSHRFAGPMYAMRRELHNLAENEEDGEPLSFREDDYWHEMADQFNCIREELINLRNGVVSSLPGDKATPEALPVNKLFDDEPFELPEDPPEIDMDAMAAEAASAEDSLDEVVELA